MEYSKPESKYILVMSLAAKCSGVSDSHLIITLTAIAILLLLSTALLYWASAGGPAWGKYYRSWPKSHKNRIPGPSGLPIIGSMGLMSGLAHRKLAEAAHSFNATRLMALSLGCTRVVITCDADVAREILNGPSFGDRPVKESAYGLMFHRAIGFAPHGTYWRALRRIASNHLFSPKQITTSGPHRAQIAAQMIKSLAVNKTSVRVRDVIKRGSLLNVMWSVFGKRYEIDEGVKELMGLVDEGYEILGMLNWSDHLPGLGWLDPQRIRSRCGRLVPKVNRFVGNIVEEHRRVGGGKLPNADFVDVLLSLQESERLSDADMVAVLWVCIIYAHFNVFFFFFLYFHFIVNLRLCISLVDQV